MTFAFYTYITTAVYNYVLTYMLTLKFFFVHKWRIRLRIWNIYKLKSASQAGILLYIDFQISSALFLYSKIENPNPFLIGTLFLSAPSLLNSRMNEQSLSLTCEIHVIPRDLITRTVPTTFPYKQSILKRGPNIFSAAISE